MIEIGVDVSAMQLVHSCNPNYGLWCDDRYIGGGAEEQLVECGEVHACHVVNIEVGCHLAKWPELQFTEAPPNKGTKITRSIKRSTPK